MKKLITLESLDTNLNTTFNIFYKYRFNKDYLKNNINKKKYSKVNSKKWYKKNTNFLNIYSINKLNCNIGLIIYNIRNYRYSIVILKKYRLNGYSSIALKVLIRILKRKKKKLITFLKKSNTNTINLHKKFIKYKKSYNSEFYYVKIL